LLTNPSLLQDTTRDPLRLQRTETNFGRLGHEAEQFDELAWFDALSGRRLPGCGGRHAGRLNDHESDNHAAIRVENRC
jgi:hypothetical protein